MGTFPLVPPQVGNEQRLTFPPAAATSDSGIRPRLSRLDRLLGQLLFGKCPDARRHELRQLRMMRFICLAQVRIDDELAVPGVRFPRGRPELFQPPMMSTDNALDVG